MHRYGVHDAEKLLHLPRTTIRALIKAGFVSPVRGPRNAWLFSFQDLIVMRTAQTLAVANVPRQRINRALKELRRQLPGAMPLSGLNISAVNNRIVVSEGRSQWQAESGQYLLAFESNPEGAIAAVQTVAAQALDAQAHFSEGVLLEGDGEDAARAYAAAIEADPALVDAQINLGRLLHERGELAAAERVYVRAIRVCTSEALLYYNLGVLLDDMGRTSDAVHAYEQALHHDPKLADGHYNLALLYEKSGKRKDAIRHLSQYRRLTIAKQR